MGRHDKGAVESADTETYLLGSGRGYIYLGAEKAAPERWVSEQMLTRSLMVGKKILSVLFNSVDKHLQTTVLNCQVDLPEILLRGPEAV